ncbi:hypothetical protein [uncultured Rothia sp.]|uniref:hypothetical protein n=1 Tax=uncultured Rothia sp. TaxID=316088 RepID=UPI0028DC6EC9|nr:hypothetical protein [uncultured Rothia sp.]
MDFKTLSPAYLTSLGAIFCGALLIGSSTPWVLWLGWILLIAALCLNVLAVLLSVGKAKGNPVPALVTNLDGLESSVETRIRKRAEHRREEEDAHAAEQPSEAHEQEAEPAQPETAQDEPREEEPTESQPVVQAPAGRLGVLPSRSRAAGRAPKPRSNVR